MGAKIATLQGELLETQGQAARQLATSLQQQAGLEGQVERLTAQVCYLAVELRHQLSGSGQLCCRVIHSVNAGCVHESIIHPHDPRQRPCDY